MEVPQYKSTVSKSSEHSGSTAVGTGVGNGVAVLIMGGSSVLKTRADE
jgi:hypothetical protein